MYGRPIVSQDGNGYLTETSYDPYSGAVTSTIQDVSVGSLFLPSGVTLTRPSQLPAAMNLTTTIVADALGRTTSLTDPNGAVTLTVYDDADHAAFTFPGVTESLDGGGNGTLTTTGPIEMSRSNITYGYTWDSDDYTGTYEEDMTFSGTVTVVDGQIVLPGFDGTNSALVDLIGNGSSGSPQYTIETLSRQLKNSAGQVVESDDYASIDNTTYLATDSGSPASGTSGTNYYATQYGYDQMGRQKFTVTPNGSITWTVFDTLGRPASTWMGTTDGGATNSDPSGGSWGHTYDDEVNNMLPVTFYEYDNGGIGDGDLTQTNLFTGSVEHTVTDYRYDWRDREIGSQVLDGTGPSTPFTYVTYDNLNDVIRQDTYGTNGTVAPILISAVSRKTQGSSTFDIPVALLGAPIIEDRVDGPTQLVLTFGDPIAEGSSFAVSLSCGTVSSTSVSGSTLTINLSGVTDGEILTVSVVDVRDSAENISGNYDFQVGVLYGDVDGNGVVDSSDAAIVTSNSGHTANATNFRADVIANGTITSGDAITSSTKLNVFGVTIGGTPPGGIQNNIVVLDPSGNFLTIMNWTDDATSIADGITGGGWIGSIPGVGAFLMAADPELGPTDLVLYYSGDGSPESWSEWDGIDYTSSDFSEEFYHAMWDPSSLTDGGSITYQDDQLRSSVVASYDNQGRPYQSTVYSVNPNTGEISTTGIVSNTWYDHDGNVIKTNTSGGVTTKIAYDGADRPITTYTTDGGGDAAAGASGNWSDATTVSGDIVLEQDSTSYDADGNTILSITRQRFNTDSSTDTGPLEDLVTGTPPTPSNNGFENATVSANSSVADPTGTTWTFSGDAGIANGTTSIGPATTAGTKAAYVEDTGFFTKLVSFPAGTYSIQFIAAKGSGSAEAITVSLSGQVIGTFTPTSSYATYTTALFTFTGSVSKFLTFTGVGTSGNYAMIDSITVKAAPAARISYVADYYDAADRLIDTLNVGNNGGSGYTRPTLANLPSRSNISLVTTYAYTPAGFLDTVTDPRGLVTKNYRDDLGRTIFNVSAWDGSYDPTGGTLPSSSDDNQTTKYTYDGDDNTLTMTAVMPSGQANQTTQYVYGDGAVFSADLLDTVEYPNASNGTASTSSSGQNAFTRGTFGQELSMTDQNGTEHVYSYDTLGRQTLDQISIVGSGIDSSIRCIATTYNSQGLVYTVTSYTTETADPDHIANQVMNIYNGFGQLTVQYQENDGAVDTSTSPKVQYSYDTPAHGSRLLSMTYPSGEVISYNYGTSGSLNDTISRLDSISDSTGTLESYQYLGVDTVVVRSQPQTGIELTYVKLSGDSVGDAGDQYTGLDRFERVVDQRWIVTSTGTAVDRYQYTYDRDGNVVGKANPLHTANNETYTYDDLNQLSNMTRNGSAYQSFDLDALGNMNSVTTSGTTEGAGDHQAILEPGCGCFPVLPRRSRSCISRAQAGES